MESKCRPPRGTAGPEVLPSELASDSQVICLPVHLIDSMLSTLGEAVPFSPVEAGPMGSMCRLPGGTAGLEVPPSELISACQLVICPTPDIKHWSTLGEAVPVSPVEAGPMGSMCRPPGGTARTEVPSSEQISGCQLNICPTPIAY